MPPFKVAASALRRTTERLARDVAQSSDSVPAWSELDWAAARAAAAMQGVSALLATRLVWSGPPLWQSFISNQREQSLLRHLHMDALLRRIDHVLACAEIHAIALKGAALRDLSLYEPGERPMGDIDLLVRPEDLASVANALGALDYVRTYETHRHVVFDSALRSPLVHFGEHIDNSLKIEVHTAVAESLPMQAVEITDYIQSTTTHPGINSYPSIGVLMLHLLLHAAGNMRAHALRQIQLHDIAVLARRFCDSDWDELLSGGSGTGGRAWWLYPPLALTERYYVGSIPDEMLRESRVACPRTLRLAAERQALTDVSWSNLRVCAFPGIAWSRTPIEAMRFMWSRVRPSRNALAELECAVRARPDLQRVPWYGLSHGVRILKWLFTRPPRVQTVLSLRAALGGADGAPD